MDKEILEKYKKAGKIAKKIREEGPKLIKPGTKLKDIAETLEDKIKELGGIPAWPVNISINEVAAHYSPSQEDEAEIKEGDLVSLDIGVSIDGYIADTAVTIFLDENDKKLVEATDKALEEALKMVKPGTDVAEISAKIEEVIKSYGFNPITNLTGHGVDQYLVHAEPKIPNYKSEHSYILEEGEVIAIEPFATRGRNFIKDSDDEKNITYSLYQEKPCRLPESRKIIDLVRDREGMPFTDRWLPFKGVKLKLAIRELISRDCLSQHKILRGDQKIAQSEHTVIVLKEPIVITK